MMLHSLIATVLVLAGARYSLGANSEVPDVVSLANSWSNGEPIPHDLLVYHDSEGCFRLPTDSVSVFEEITNYPLLQKLISSSCDQRIFEFAVRRALYLVGPTRFFSDQRKVYAAHPELWTEQRHQHLNDLSTKRHIVVDGIFINDRDMTRPKADAVFKQITNDLQSGAPFEAVKKKYYSAYEYRYTETLSNGKKVRLTKTRVGNYGDFVISEGNRDARPFRSAEVPLDHAHQLVTQQKGDIVALRDESEHRTILYQVREVYVPSA
jgi:hypothetical protein